MEWGLDAEGHLVRIVHPHDERDHGSVVEKCTGAIGEKAFQIEPVNGAALGQRYHASMATDIRQGWVRYIQHLHSLDPVQLVENRPLPLVGILPVGLASHQEDRVLLWREDCA